MIIERKGSVTVFLSLILVLLLSIFLVSLESAHLAAVHCNVTMECHAVTDELLSRYEMNLYDQYKIYALNDRMDFQDLIEKDMSAYNKNGVLSFNYGNFLSFSYQKIRTGAYTYLTDDDCESFQEQIPEILAADAVDIGKQFIADYLSSLSQGARLTSVMNDIMSESSALTKVSALLSEVSEKLEGLKEKKKELTEKVSVLSERLSKDSSEAGDEEMKEEVSEVREAASSISKLKNDLLKDYRDVYLNLTQALGSMKEISENLKGVLSGINTSGDSLKDIKKAVKSMTDLVSDTGSLYQAVYGAVQKVKGNTELLDQLEIPSLTEISEETIKNGKLAEKVTGIKTKIAGILSASLKSFFDSADSEGDDGTGEFIENVKKMMKGDLLGMILGDETEISERTFSMSEYPSDKSTGFLEILDSKIFENPNEALTDELFLNLYLYQYMDCYKEGNLYDLEYILGGKKTDRKNLSSALLQLVLLRQTANMITIMSDSKKMEEIEAAAAALAAVTVLPLFKDVMKIVIVAAWAFAEGVCDVRKLTSGEKVEFIKPSSKMTLSLKGAKNVSSWSKVGKGSDIGSKSGLTYKQYLLILLFFHLSSVKRYRALDVIQWNLQQQDSGFLISQCVTAMNIDFSVSAGNIFASGITSDNKKLSSRWKIEHTERAAYGSG